MAIVIELEPATYSPAFNPNYFTIDSTNKNQTGFAYVVDIYASGTANKIWEGRLSPEDVNGYGVLNVSKILSGMLNRSDIPINSSNWHKYTGRFYKYDIKFGEEYVVSYTIGTPVNDGGYLQLTTTAVNTFALGDQVVISGADVSGVDGLFTIIEVIDTDTFVIDLVYTGAMASLTTGSITYSDNRKTITRDLTTSLNKYIFDAAYSHNAFINYTDDDILIDLSSSPYGSFLTNAPDGYRMAENVDAWINAISPATQTYCYYAYFENSDGDIIRRQITSGSNFTIVGIAVGPGNANPNDVVSGSLPLIKDSTEFYDVWCADSDGVQRSQKFRFTIDRRCSINDTFLIFKDRKGSFMPFSFTLRQTENFDLTSVLTTNRVGSPEMASAGWPYSQTESSRNVIDMNETRRLTLVSNWLNDDESVYIRDLFSSPEVFINDADGGFEPVEILDKSFQRTRQKNKNMIQYTINVRFTNNDPINILP